jgi:recombination DNA repair RAD52 pathway protein
MVKGCPIGHAGAIFVGGKENGSTGVCTTFTPSLLVVTTGTAGVFGVEGWEKNLETIHVEERDEFSDWRNLLNCDTI